MNKNIIKILVADDHPIFREGLIKIIHREKNMRVIDCVGNGSEAAAYIRNANYDIAILDISMPGLTGLEIAKIIFNEKLRTYPIILTMYSNEEYLEEALENDVRGYLLKETTMDEIIDCIKTILNGGFYISKELTNYLIKNKNQKSSKKELNNLIDSLTQTEKQILKLLSENKTSGQIASELFVSVRTVQNHRTNIAHKLHLYGYNKLFLFALEHKALL